MADIDETDPCFGKLVPMKTKAKKDPSASFTIFFFSAFENMTGPAQQIGAFSGHTIFITLTNRVFDPAVMIASS